MSLSSPRGGRLAALLGGLLVLGVGCGYANVPDPAKDAGTQNPAADSGVIGAACLDNDGDGVPGTGTCTQMPVDCDDADPARYPGGVEICDDLDNDCDGAIDEDLPQFDHFTDADGDGHGAGAPMKSCHAMVEGLVTQGGDCDDADALKHPGAPEACNSLDDDCDGTTDDNIQYRDFFTDADADGFGTGTPTNSCEASLPGKVAQGGDCNDANAQVKPGAAEVCNNLDDNCDGNTDETFATKGNACQTTLSGPCAMGTWQCVSGTETCVGLTQPATEICDAIDNDCDGAVDEPFGNKGQSCSAGLGVCAASGTYVCSSDGSQTECSATAGTPTTAACDMQDNDCDGQVDETELTTWWSVNNLNVSDIDLTPYFYSAGSCSGGTGTSGTDAWSDYYAAYAVNGNLYAQKLDEDGYALSFTPYDFPDLGNNNQISVAQARDGFVVAALWGSTYIDLYYVGNGLAARTLNSANEFTVHNNSGATISNVRAVRGNGGRVVILWRETVSGVSKIRFARVTITPQSGTNYTAQLTTAPTDLITTAGSTGGFGVASTHEEYGDSLGCPQGLARFAVAHTIVSGGTRSVKLDVFNEDGTSTLVSQTVYSTTSTSLTPADPDVAWAYVSGDRWGVVHSVSSSLSNYERLNFWQSGQAGNSSAFGSNFTGSGTNSIQEPRISARTADFLITALVHATSTAANEPQVFAGKKDHSGVTVAPLAAVTASTGCSQSFCTTGNRKAARPLSNASGVYKGSGGVLFGGSSGNVRSGLVGCN